MTILQYISLIWIRFTPLEKRLLAEVRSVLPAPARETFDFQVSAITKSQRILDWNQISYYCIRRGKASWEDVPMFPCTDEMKLAEVRFRAIDKPFKATLYGISGHIFEFHLQPGGRPIAFATWENAPRATLLDDPMREPTGRRKLVGILPVWVRFLAGRESSEIGGWTLNDAQSAYSVSLKSGEFLILAECEGDEFILQRLDPPSNDLFYLSSHDGTPEPLTQDIESVIGNRGQQGVQH